MKTPKFTPKSLLPGVLLVAAACSPPSVHQEAEGREVILTMAEPEAEFEVTVCVDRPSRVEITSAWMSVNADIEVVAGERTGVVRGLLDAAMDEWSQDEVDLDAPERTDGFGADGDFLAFDLDGEGPWDEAGRQCSEPQLMRFEYLGEDPMAELRVSWTVSFVAQYNTEGLRGARFSGDDVSIEIEPVE